MKNQFLHTDKSIGAGENKFHIRPARLNGHPFWIPVFHILTAQFESVVDVRPDQDRIIELNSAVRFA